MKRLSLSVAAAALAIGMAQAAHGFAAAQTAVQPSPQPAPTAQIQLPKAKATATPAPPKAAAEKRVGISGVWEVQIQQSSGTVYTHFKLNQIGTALTGQYLDTSGKKYPLQGSVDQKNVHIVVTLPSGNALVFSGTVDGAMDMEGTLDNAKDTIGFTAAYRPKYKWIDNLSPSPVGGQTGVPR